MVLISTWLHIYLQVAVGARRPYLDEEGFIHWPVLLTYPETLQQDVVEDWHEEDTLAEHLDVVSQAEGGWVSGRVGVSVTAPHIVLPCSTWEQTMTRVLVAFITAASVI